MRLFILSILSAVILCSSIAHSSSVAGRTLRVGVMPTVPPFSFLVKDDGTARLRGVSVDIMGMLESVLHARMKYLECSDLTQRRDWLDQSRIDIIPLEHGDPDMISRGFRFIPLDLSMHRHLFVNKKCDTVVCTNDFSGKRVAVITGDRAHPYLENVSEKDIVYVTTSLEALKLVDQGLADVFLATSERTARYIVQKEGLAHVKEVGLDLGEIPLGLAVKNDDEELVRELVQAVAYLKRAGKIDLVREKWFGRAFGPTFWERYARTLMFGASLILFILLFIIVWNYQLKKRVRKVTGALLESEKKYRGLIESSPDMILLVDKHGKILLTNDIGAAFFPEGEDLFRIVWEEDRDRLKEFFERAFNDLRSCREFRFSDAGGKLREMDVAATLVPAVGTDGRKICCFARDVTERNRIENELVQADRLATIGKMAAGVAHEINNPIGIVQANIDLILTHDLYDEKAREFLEAAHRNAVRAGTITRELLAIAKPKQPEMAEVDLNKLLTFTLSMLSPQLKHVEVENALCEVDRKVWGDANLLQQVLVNLLLNARAAMENSAEKKLRISSCAPPGEALICLRINDTGVGIPREKLREIFEPFFSSGKREGFGLGLFISKRIVERHGGEIYAESEEGRGTQMVIELPTLAETGVKTISE